MPGKKKKGNGTTINGKTQSGARGFHQSNLAGQNEDSSEIDSDSTGDEDDSQFAAKMTNVQKNMASANSKKGSGTQGKTLGGASAPVYSSNTKSGNKTQGFVEVKNTTKAGNMGLDSFTSNTSPPPPLVSLKWPFEDKHEFRLACTTCFVKEREGIRGSSLHVNMNHPCRYDLLLVRSKNNPDWLKVRPRNTSSGMSHSSSYKLCMQYRQNQPCRIGEANCTFAHSPIEIMVWNKDRDREFSIPNFLREAKKEGIYSSEILLAQRLQAGSHKTSGSNQPNIPGLHYVDKSRHTLSHQLFSTPQTQNSGPQSKMSASPKKFNVSPVGGLSQITVPHKSRISPQSTAKSTLSFTSQSLLSKPSFNISPPSVSSFSNNNNVKMSPPQAQNLPNLSKPPPSQFPPNLNQPPPSANLQQNSANPFPQYEFRLGCPECLHFNGVPWFYNLDTRQHSCTQIWWVYHIQDERGHNVWVRIRDRTAHGDFKGNYILCLSVKTKLLDKCKFKENCSFAHNVIEQDLWKREQKGLFDIGEFIMCNRKFEASSTLGTPLMMDVKSLLDKFGGYFRFICRNCFFSNQPKISGKGPDVYCSGAARHMWNDCMIIAHVVEKQFTPIDQRKFTSGTAFFLRCNRLHFCHLWFQNRCHFAHSEVEKQVWMLERNTGIAREELVRLSIELNGSGGKVKGNAHQGSPPSAWGAGVRPGQQQQQPQQQQQHVPTTVSGSVSSGPPVSLAQLCRTCWGNGQRCGEDGDKDKCSRGHSNFKVNSLFVATESGKEIRPLPSHLPAGMRYILCDFRPNCKRPVCTHPHSQEELDVWEWMKMRHVKSLKDAVMESKALEKSRTRKISKGESVVNVSMTKATNQIIAPGDLFLSEHYCSYCGISCNSTRQWDNHRMSERHINNVNSDKEHQWNFRQPPWGQGNNLALCAKHMYDQSCQYSHVPDMYNLCKYAHSQLELDEWRERHEWRQMKRSWARDTHMFSYAEALLMEFYKQENSISVITENLNGVSVTCRQEQTLYKEEKNAIFTWTFILHTQKELEKTALLYNKDRLHFVLKCSDGSNHQVAPGDLFLDVDAKGNACYKVDVHFTGGMFGSFSQWVVFDFGSRPVLVKKITVEIGSQLQHEKVRELRDDLSLNRWTSQNREIVRSSEVDLDQFTEQLLQRYKEPSHSEVTQESLVTLNQHNYVHKMHRLLELEEMTRSSMIASYNMVTTVVFSQMIIEPGVLLGAKNGDLFMKVQLTEDLTEDTTAGKLLLSSVTTVLFAPTDSRSNKVYEASLVGDYNYSYDGRGKEHIYVTVGRHVVETLGLADKVSREIELQFQMDRKRFCRMHYALDCLRTNDVIFPDVMKYKPNMGQLIQHKARSDVLNEDQMMAVRHIVTERQGYTPPFIMYGPFGTGKTETLAQASMALLKTKQNVHILICTQSNSAADLYILKHFLAFIKKNRSINILRLISEERRPETVPPEVLEFCCLTPDRRGFLTPSKQDLQKYQVVLTTVENSMQLVSLDLFNFFTHIFVDEAGQTLECETLMPLTLASSQTCVVLSGDHHQISPAVYSQEARSQHFDVSILVRLYNFYEQMTNSGLSQLSETAKQSPLNILLSINYRTKQEILRFISSVFYGGPDNLKAYGKIPSVVQITPLMFYAVQGREVQNEDSVSFVNYAEAQEVVEQVESLLDSWPQEWGDRNAESVAVMANYRDQITCIRTLLRKKSNKPWLCKVNVKHIINFQGCEYRALFITTVRTTHLLQERHITRALDTGGDIGDLGFLSNPKMLNTALTRAQSFVGVVGDPVALCLIGECIQEWRTYLKHCSNMKSVRPQTVTYDAVRNQVIQIQISPSGPIVDLISKRSRDNYKQTVKPKQQQQATNNNHLKPVLEGQEGLHVISNRLDEDEQDIAGNGQTSIPKYSSSMPSSGTTPSVRSSLSPENRHILGAEERQQQVFQDNMSAIAEMDSEEAILQLAEESIPGGQIFGGKECVFLEEEEGFAVLRYSEERVGLAEPFQVVSDSDNFVAFDLELDDSEPHKIFENWGHKLLQDKLASKPQEFFRGIISIDGENANVRVVGLGKESLIEGRDIFVPGLMNRGHAFHGDEVVVQLTHGTEGSPQGQVKGVLNRSLNLTSRLLVCKADAEHPGTLCPLNSDLPHLYSLTCQRRLRLARKCNVGVYKLNERGSLQFSHYEKTDPTGLVCKLFIVKYLHWPAGFQLPCAVVVGVVEPADSLERGLKVLEIEHNVNRSLSPDAQAELQSVFPEGSVVPDNLSEGRSDLTGTQCFTVDAEMTEDLEMAISVGQIDGPDQMCYEIAVHVSDVSAFIRKDSVLDRECTDRGTSLFMMSHHEPQHLLPIQLCLDMGSLRPGFDRLAISVSLQVDKEGKPLGPPNIFRSVVKSKQHFSHAEVQDILLCSEESHEYLHSCIMVLYQLTYLWRTERLGNAHFSINLEPGQRPAQHSHIMINELKTKFNSLVADALLSKFDQCTPLLVQPEPPSGQLEEWRRSNAGHALNCVPLARAFLKDQVCRCTRACTCVFGYIRQNRLAPPEAVSMLKDAWRQVNQAVREDVMDFELAQDMITSSESKPFQAVATHQLETLLPTPAYVCAGQVSVHKHYGLCMGSTTSWMSPLRQYFSLVVQRMMTALIDNKGSPYTLSEMEQLCAQATKQEREADSFHRSVFLLHLSSALAERPLVLNAYVEECDADKITLRFPNLAQVPESLQTVWLRQLDPMKVRALPSKSDQVVVQWEERIYSHNVESVVQCETDVQLDTDRLVCHIPTMQWQKLLMTIREKNEAGISNCVREINSLVGPQLEAPSGNRSEIVSAVGKDSGRRHFVKYGFTFHPSQAVQVQICGSVEEGILRPSLQLLQLAPGLDVCVEHHRHPDKCFADPAEIVTTKSAKDHPDDLSATVSALLPMLALESAESAVRDGGRITFRHLNILWHEGVDDKIEGVFFLSQEFCEVCCFLPDQELQLASALLDNQPLHTSDPNFSLAYLCVRYSNLSPSPEDLNLEEEVSAVLTSSQQHFTWSAHCRVTDVLRSQGGYQIKCELVSSAMPVPTELLMQAEEQLSCTVEWIGKTSDHSLMDIALRGLHAASEFAKEIFTGRKPTNTIDPVPQDNTVLKSRLSDLQEAAISTCYQQPFTVVEGGPGTGKSLCAARLAHLLVQRNRSADAFRQIRQPGFTSQVLICAPTEGSLDVITGLFQVLDCSQVPVVRVYSEEVEDRDYPMPQQVRADSSRQPSCAVMEDIALHHLVRKPENPESQTLMEHEMYLAMGAGSLESGMLAEVRACLDRAQTHVLSKARVIICTCATSARPILKQSTNIKQIILDDASLISETEALISLVTHRSVNQMVLFGDLQMPQPSLVSPLAKQHILARSLLARHRDRAIQLSQQFRMLPNMISFSSNRFYAGKLTTSTESQSWASAPTIPWPGEAGFPSVFLHMEGREEKLVDEGNAQGSSGGGITEESIVNSVEADTVVTLVQALLGCHKVKATSIHVLTFTQAQATKVKDLLPASVTVSTVKESLGRESEYVILSCVRSVPWSSLQPHPTGQWISDHLGSVAIPALVNLALTRANIALFIVGNRYLLNSCKIWSEVVDVYRERQSLEENSQMFLGSVSV